MIRSSSDIERFCGLTDSDAYRSYLISRNQGPIVHHSGEMHLKRLRVLVRHVGNRIKGFLATIHLAIVAGRMRQLQRELTYRHVRRDAIAGNLTHDRLRT